MINWICILKWIEPLTRKCTGFKGAKMIERKALLKNAHPCAKIIGKYFWIAALATLFPALLKERWKLVNFRDQAFAQLNYKIYKIYISVVEKLFSNFQFIRSKTSCCN